MRLNLTLSQKGLILVSVPLICQLILVAAIAGLHNEAEQEARKSEHSKKISAATNAIVRDIFDVMVVTKGEEMSKVGLGTAGYHQSMNEIRKQLSNLQELVKNNPDDLKIVESSNAAATRAMQLMNSCEAAYNSGNNLELMEALRKSRKELRYCIKGIISNELLQIAQQHREIEEASPEKQARSRELVSLIIFGAVVLNAIATIFTAWFFRRRIMSRLNVLQDNSFRLASHRPLNEPLEGEDEIGEVDRTFHSMAEALVEAARKENAVIENAADVICSLDAKGNFISANPATERVLGYKPADLIGNKFVVLFEKDDVDNAIVKFKSACQGEFVPPFETSVLRGDGKPIDLLWSVHWSRSESSLFCVAHDFTDRKKAERMKQEVVAMVSHDLRNPLATIRGFLEMLETGIFGTLNERGSKLLVIANRNTNRMLTLARDLLEIEKMESGMLDIEPKLVSLANTFEHCSHATIALASEKKVKVIFQPTDLSAFADDDRLVQIITNLLTNAIKFSPEGEIIKVIAHDGEKMLTISVEDKGRGIPQKLLSQIFERYKQVEQSDATEKGGTGLGLAICKALVELMGGTISVESAPGKGSKFAFTIPKCIRPALTGDALQKDRSKIAEGC